MNRTPAETLRFAALLLDQDAEGIAESCGIKPNGNPPDWSKHPEDKAAHDELRQVAGDLREIAVTIGSLVFT